MSERTTIKLNDQELMTYVWRCFEWSNADVFAFGQRDSISRLGEIAAYISQMADKDGKPRADSVRIVLPPLGARDRQAMLQDIKEGIRRAYRRMESDDAKTAPFIEETFANVEVEQADNFAVASLDVLLATTKDRQAVIIGEASHYRADVVGPPDDGPRFAEYDWCRHLHAVMLRAEERAQGSGSYIILDIGQCLPVRKANQKFLETAGNVGLCGVSHTDDLTPEEVIAMVDAAYEAASVGDVGKALSLIDNDDRLSDIRKWMLRLIVLERAGMRDEVSRILDASSDTIATLKSDGKLLLEIARIAAGVDRDDYAQDIVERTLPGLLAINDLESALRVALDTRRQPLIALVRERLRDLHPGSHMLSAVDARAAARVGDYVKAADLLSKLPDAKERTLGEMFRLLANAVASPDFPEPVKLARDLAAKMPDRTADMQREIMLSLERANRRDKAVEMLFSDDVAWDEHFFVFACGLLSRSLASGSDAVGPEAMSLLVAAASAYIAEHPAAGYVRTSVTDLLDAEHAGTKGLAVMVMNAIERAERLPEVEEGDGREPTQLDDIRQLPRIMESVLVWLTEKGGGIIVAGRDAVPVEVLREDPDAVLHSIHYMVDHLTLEPYDPVEESVLRNIVTVALAVAPSAADTNADLLIVRGVAVKAIFAGRPQFARDLAESRF